MLEFEAFLFGVFCFGVISSKKIEKGFLSFFGDADSADSILIKIWF
jgi:hypothetical protein